MLRGDTEKVMQSIKNEFSVEEMGRKQKKKLRY